MLDQIQSEVDPTSPSQMNGGGAKKPAKKAAKKAAKKPAKKAAAKKKTKSS